MKHGRELLVLDWASICKALADQMHDKGPNPVNMGSTLLGKGPNNVAKVRQSPWLLWALSVLLFLTVALYYPVELGSSSCRNEQSRSRRWLWKEEEEEEGRNIMQGRQDCEGRWIYMYELPREFNEELLERCRKRERERQCEEWDCVPCERLGVNHGMGPGVREDEAPANGSEAGGGPGVSGVELVPRGAWYETDQFAAEVIFHERMKRYECLTQDAGRAAAFYVPFYAGADLAFTLFSPHVQLRDELTQRLLGWLSGHPAWRRARGRHRAISADGAASAAAARPSDHFLVLGRIAWDFHRAPSSDGWGSSLLRQPDFLHVTPLAIERRLHDHHPDVALPYPTAFHPSSMDDIIVWQEMIRDVKRPWLVTFLGASTRKFDKETMRQFRVELMHQCSENNNKCKAIECNDDDAYSTSMNMDVIKCSYDYKKVMNALITSVFCLQPRGDSATRRGFFDSIVAGCIPVVFDKTTAYEQYLWHLPSTSSQYSIFISEDDLVSKRCNLLETLANIPQEKVMALQKAIRELIPRIIYSSLPLTSLKSHLQTQPLEDAFDITLHAYLDQLK